MHFIVFHYVIVCFIAFHLFSSAVGGGMAQEHHFSGDDVLWVEWNQRSPVPLPFPPLHSPQARTRFPKKLRYFLLWSKANPAFPPHKAVLGEAISSKYLEVSTDMRPSHSLNHKEKIFEVLHSSHLWYFVPCPKDIFSLDLEPCKSWCLERNYLLS